MKAYLEKAIPLKGADTISVMLSVPKHDWSEIAKLVMQDVEISAAVSPAPAEPDTVEAIEQRMTAALAEAALCGRKLIEMATARQAAKQPLFAHPMQGDFPDHREKP